MYDADRRMRPMDPFSLSAGDELKEWIYRRNDPHIHLNAHLKCRLGWILTKLIIGRQHNFVIHWIVLIHQII